jgi:hypothetical protein
MSLFNFLLSDTDCFAIAYSAQMLDTETPFSGFWLASGMSHAAHPCLRKTTRRSMFNRLLGNVKLVRYVLQLLSDYYNFLTVRYKRRPL